MAEEKALLTTTKERHSRLSDFAKTRNVSLGSVTNLILDYTLPLLESEEIELVEPHLRIAQAEEAGA